MSGLFLRMLLDVRILLGVRMLLGNNLTWILICCTIDWNFNFHFGIGWNFHFDMWSWWNVTENYDLISIKCHLMNACLGLTAVKSLGAPAIIKIWLILNVYVWYQALKRSFSCLFKISFVIKTSLIQPAVIEGVKGIAKKRYKVI